MEITEANNQIVIMQALQLLLIEVTGKNADTAKQIEVWLEEQIKETKNSM